MRTFTINAVTGAYEESVKDIKRAETAEAVARKMIEEGLPSMEIVVPQIPTGFGAVSPPTKADVGGSDIEQIIRRSTGGLIGALYLKNPQSVQKYLADQTARKTDADSPLVAVNSLAKLTPEAYDTRLGVVIDARKGSYDVKGMIAEIKKVAASGSSPVKYMIIAETGSAIQRDIEEAAASYPGMICVAVSKGDDVLQKVSDIAKSNGITNNSASSIALTENNIAVIEGHYIANSDISKSQDRFNFLVSPASSDGNIPAATLLNLLIKLASKDQTSVMLVGCAPDTESIFRRMQENVLKGALMLVRIAKLEIEKIVRDYLASAKASAQSL